MKSPLILFNPREVQVEFMYDHKVYVFLPGEKKLLDWDVASHGIGSGCGVVEYTGAVEDIGYIPTGKIAYDKMPWKKVVALASKRGLFKPGMGKEAVLKALDEADAE